MGRTKFNPDYLCGLPACEENTRGIVAEFNEENQRLRRLLKWARTCVPFESDCHKAIVEELSDDQ